MATNIAVQRCFAYTFDGCTSLESIKVHYTVWPGNAGHSLPVQQEWLQDTASNGTFICPASLPDIRGTTFIPDTWTKVDL